MEQTKSLSWREAVRRGQVKCPECGNVYYTMKKVEDLDNTYAFQCRIGWCFHAWTRKGD